MDRVGKLLIVTHLLSCGRSGDECGFRHNSPRLIIHNSVAENTLQLFHHLGVMFPSFKWRPFFCMWMRKVLTVPYPKSGKINVIYKFGSVITFTWTASLLIFLFKIISSTVAAYILVLKLRKISSIEIHLISDVM